MDNDNIYPRDGQYFNPAPPKDQQKTADKKQEETLAQVPLLNEILERLDKRIAFYDSVDSVPDEVQTNPEEFMHVVASNKLTRDNLKAERGYIFTRISEVQ